MALPAELQQKVDKLILDIFSFFENSKARPNQYMDWLGKLYEIQTNYQNWNSIPKSTSCFEEISQHVLVDKKIQDLAAEINKLHQELMKSQNMISNSAVLSNVNLSSISSNQSWSSNQFQASIGLEILKERLAVLLEIELDKFLRADDSTDFSNLAILSTAKNNLKTYDFKKPLVEEYIAWLRDLTKIDIAEISEVATDLLNSYNPSANKNTFTSFQFFKLPQPQSTGPFKFSQFLKPQEVKAKKDAQASLLNALCKLQNLDTSQKAMVDTWIKDLSSEIEDIFDLNDVAINVKKSEFIESSIKNLAEDFLKIDSLEDEEAASEELNITLESFDATHKTPGEKLKHYLTNVRSAVMKLNASDRQITNEIDAVASILKDVCVMSDFKIEDIATIRKIFDIRKKKFFEALDPQSQIELTLALESAEDVINELQSKKRKRQRDRLELDLKMNEIDISENSKKIKSYSNDEDEVMTDSSKNDLEQVENSVAESEDTEESQAHSPRRS